MAGLKKKVDVQCNGAFKLGVTRFAGYCNGIILDTDAIRICLQNKAMVHEVLRNGKRVALDFSNFMQKNPMGFDVDGEQNEFLGARPYQVKTIGAEGKVNVADVQLKDAQIQVKKGHTAPINTSLNTTSNAPIITKSAGNIKTATAPELKTASTTTPVNSSIGAEMTATVTVAPDEKKKEEQQSNNKNDKDKDKKHHK